MDLRYIIFSFSLNFLGQLLGAFPGLKTNFTPGAETIKHVQIVQ